MTLYFCINKICIWSHVNYSWSCFLHSCIVIFSDLWELMSWHGGRKGGSWGTVKFLYQCPSLILFLLLAHHVAVLDLWLIYALSFEILGRKKFINSKGILVCQNNNKKIPVQNITRNPFPTLLLSPMQPFQLEQSFRLSIISWCRGTAPKLPCVCAGGRGEDWCAGVSGWAPGSTHVYSGTSADAIVSFCLSWGMLCMSATCGVCMPCSAGCCWKCLCICVSVHSVCVHVHVHVCFVSPVGICIKSHDRKIIISGGKSV